MRHRPPRRSTPAGTHRPVLLDEVLELFRPLEHQTVIDCTLGFAGHSEAILRHLGKSGKLVGIDLDSENVSRAQPLLETIGFPFALHHGNFAGLPNVLAGNGLAGAHRILADLGMSSMQVDDPERGFSYVRDGPLDMRMDRSRGQPAAAILQTISEQELATSLRELADEEQADAIAQAIVVARQRQAITRTTELARIIVQSLEPKGAGKPWRLRPTRSRWQSHPAMRTFQVLRILVNRELANLHRLLQILPDCLLSGGMAAIISFHSGEDRLVKAAFREGLARGLYEAIAREPVRASEAEKLANPRARSAKLRWARKRSMDA